MEKIKKGLQLKLSLVAIGVLFLCAMDLYSYADALRVPIGDETNGRIGAAIDKASDSSEQILIGRVFKRKGYVNINALRRFLQEVALNVGLNLDKMRPVLIGSAIYFADKDGYVNIRMTSDIDIWWGTREDLERNTFQSCRNKFINKLKELLSGEVGKKEVGRNESSDSLFIKSPDSLTIKISISKERGRDVINTTIKGINHFLTLEKGVMESLGLYKAVRRYMMILYYAKAYLNDTELERRFDEFKTRLLTFSTDENASQSGYRQLFEDVHAEVSRIKNDIQARQGRLSDAIRLVLFGVRNDSLKERMLNAVRKYPSYEAWWNELNEVLDKGLAKYPTELAERFKCYEYDQERKGGYSSTLTLIRSDGLIFCDVWAGMFIIDSDVTESDIIGSRNEFLGCTACIFQGERDGRTIIAYAHLTHPQEALKFVLDTIEEMELENPHIIFDIPGTDMDDLKILIESLIDSLVEGATPGHFPTIFKAQQNGTLLIFREVRDFQGIQLTCTKEGFVRTSSKGSMPVLWDEIKHVTTKRAIPSTPRTDL